MFTLERAAGSRRVGLVSLIGLVLVPLLVAGGFLWATWNSDTRLDRVQAAIVNDDEPVKLDGQTVPLGRQLAGGLVTGGDEVSKDENFDWLLTDQSDAAAGLADGRYAAVVRIPKDFSARATSFSKSEAAEIEPAEITVETSQIRGIADSVVGQTIAAAATSALNTSLTKNYLDNIYIGFNKTKESFTDVAKGARKLADGTEKLSDGIGQTSTGTKQLAKGLDQLDDGTQQLATGAGQLSTGTTQLADGIEKLADGQDKLATGAGQLASGLREYRQGTKKAAAGADEFADGLGEYASGSKKYATGTGQYADGLDQYASFLATLQKADPAALQKLGISCPVPDPQACALFYGGIQAAGTAANKGLTESPTKDKSLLSGSKELAAGAKGLAGGAGQLADGADELSSGLGKLDDGAKKLATGAKGLSTGTKQLASGLAKTSTGADKLATGTSELATGTKDLANGTSQSAAGAQKLSDGIVKLDDGGTKLADGSDELASGLEKGAKQIPTYDETTRTKLAEVVATPVQAEQPKTLFADIANTTFLAAIALWLGGLASFIVLRAIPAGVLTSMRSSWRLALGTFAPAAAIAAVQAVALTVVLQILLKLDAGQVGQLLPFLLLAGLAFAAVNQGLVAWLGGVGRFISVGLVVLAAAAAITSAVPAVFDSITPLLPLTPALEGARAITSSGSGTVGTVALLLAWLIVGLAASITAVARHRVAPARAPVPATT